MADSVMQGWQPIETAPTNRALLVHIPHAEYYGNNGVYAAMLVDVGTGKRWMTFGLHIGSDCGHDSLPDAWQDIPFAPTPEHPHD